MPTKLFRVAILNFNNSLSFPSEVWDSLQQVMLMDISEKIWNSTI